MKKRLLSVAFLMGAWGAYSQVGIGTTAPNKSSQLEIVAKDRGVLIPQVPLRGSTDETTITNNNVNSLLVWNTSTIADITPGYYYWFENKWMRIVSNEELEALHDANTTNTSLTVQGSNLVLMDSEGNTVSIPLASINIPTSLENNGDGTYTYTSEDGTTTIIDVPNDVINNFQNIVNNTNVLNKLVEVLKNTTVGGNVSYDGNQFTYVDGNNVVQNITFEEIVKGNETITSLLDNGDGTITYTNEAGIPVTVNLAKGPKGEDGATPEIGPNGNWWIGGTDTTIAAQGPKGDTGKSALEIWQSLPGNDGKDGADFIADITGKDGVDGVDGKSAYEVAVGDGFVGTESEWLLSLIGDKGADGKSALEIWQSLPGNDGKDGTAFIEAITGKDGVDGTDGVTPEIGPNGNWWIGGTDTTIAAQGPKGNTGKSAYEEWVDAGNTGSEQDFLDSLKGDQGIQGIAGTDGSDGKSAYEEWIDAGNTGSEQDFLDSLKGDQGIQGIAGTDGSDGKSAYEEWIDAGNTGSEQDFLDSLKGDQGIQGIGITTIVTNPSNPEEAIVTYTNGTTDTIILPKGEDGTSVSITSITPDASGNNVVTFSDGKTMTVLNGVDGIDGTDGVDGISITTIVTNPSNPEEAIVTYTDGTTDTITLPKGEDGTSVSITSITPDASGNNVVTFSDGKTMTVLNGVDGIDGVDGVDGIGITTIVTNPSNPEEAIITYTDGTTDTITLPKGEDGTSVSITSITPDASGNNVVTFSDGKTMTVLNGVDGIDGADGVDGIGITTIVTNPSNPEEAIVTYTNGTTDTITLPKGEDGTSVSITSITPDASGNNVVTFSDGKTMTVLNGVDGIDGADGVDGIGITTIVTNPSNPEEAIVTYTNGTTDTIILPKGEDGTSVSITSITPDASGNNVVTFSDGKTMTVLNGVDGIDGADGVDGIGITTIVTNPSNPEEAIVTYTNGTTDTITLPKGEDGTSVSITSITPDASGNNVVTFSDGKTMTVLNGVDGIDGADGQDGTDGLTPHIGANGNWEIGGADTGIAAQGPQGPQGPAGVVNPKDLTAADTSITVTNGTGTTLVDTNIKVTDGGITNSKLADDAVTTDKIEDGTIKPEDIANAGSNQVLVTGADNKPVWKDQNKVAPQFFYMPAVIFDTTVTGEATRDLYQEYVNQFTGGAVGTGNAPYDISHGPTGTTPLQYGGGIVGSAGAPADIAVLEKGDLYYYVTYYDEAVFENLSIDVDGKLTYTVKAGATPSSYMNIVFVIK